MPRKIQYIPKPLSAAEKELFSKFDLSQNPLAQFLPKPTLIIPENAAEKAKIQANKQRMNVVLGQLKENTWSNLPAEISKEQFSAVVLPLSNIPNNKQVKVDATFHSQRVDADEEKMGLYDPNDADYADLRVVGRGTKEYNVFTVNTVLADKRMIKPYINKMFDRIDSNPYSGAVRLIKNKFLIKQVEEVQPIENMRIRASLLEREGLINPSSPNNQGFCCIDVLVEHLKDVRQKHSGKPCDRAYVESFFKAIRPDLSEGFTVSELTEVAEKIGCPSFTVYRGHQLYRSSSFNDPIIDEQFKSAHKLKIKPLVVVIVDAHVYISPLALSTGVGRASQKPGLMDYMTAATGQFVVVDKFLDEVPDNVKYVYIRGPANSINEYFLNKLWDNGLLIKSVEVCEKTMNVTKIEYQGRIWVYQPDIDKCVKLIAPSKTKYKGESFHFLLKQYARRAIGLYESVLNPAAYRMFRSEYAKGYGEMGWMPGADRKQWKKFQYADVRQCYQSCMLMYMHQVTSIGDEITPYDGHDVLPYASYFVVAPGRTKCLLMNGPGKYNGLTVIRALADKIIRPEDIKYQYIGRPSKATFMQLIHEVNERLGENDNLSFNKLVGLLHSSTARYDNTILYSQSWDEIMNVFMNSPNCQIQKLDFKTNTAEEADYDHIHHVSGRTNQGVLLCANSYRETPKLDNFLAAHHMIINLMHLVIWNSVKAIADYNKKDWKECVAGIYVDCIAFFPDIILPEHLVLPDKQSALPGQLVRSKPFAKAGVLTSIIKDRQFEPTDNANYISCLHNTYYDQEGPRVEIKMIDELSMDHSAAICAPGGYGKSFTAGRFINQLLAANKQVICCSWTHSTVENIDKMCSQDIAQTVSSVLGLGFGGEKEQTTVGIEDKGSQGKSDNGSQDKKLMQSKIHKFIDWLVIDEYTLIPSYVWAIIYKQWKRFGFKLLICGDENQLISVEDDESQPIRARNSLIAEMVGGRFLRLTVNFRAMKDPYFADWLENVLAKGGNPNPEDFGEKLCDLNIVATNSLRTRINTALAKKYGGSKWRCFPGLPIICESNNSRVYKNGMEFTVESADGINVTIKRKNWKDEEVKYTISMDEYERNFEISFAITAHKAQGRSFDRDYAIWETNHYLARRHGWLYVAFSRATHSRFVHFGSMRELEELEAEVGGLVVGAQHSYVYGLKIYNRLVYVGQTNNVERRITEHKTGAGCPEIYEIIQTYGEECFSYEILWSGPPALANAQENNFIEINRGRLFNKLNVAGQN